ncbi:histone-lysine N-methyltransferase SETMAR-like [Octopus sinensis]|uniref:Histone-lysine N-methyltransferase SETMAR-like n=1 Tax=Octopus sinensis TaxID=2607531 RepID=A0A6P7TIS7_9MOLL|nr:histone-lysine N-methyltransferase SETMAR-like [Octopus sinensis]
MTPKLLPYQQSMGRGSTRDHTVRRWFQEFRSDDESLKDEESRGRSCSLDNEQLKVIVEENPCLSVREMPQTLGVSIEMVSHNLQKISQRARHFHIAPVHSVSKKELYL